MARSAPRLASSEALRAVYDRATRGAKTHPSVFSLADATGDPLAASSPEIAAAVHGIDRAPRPNVALRHLFEATFGSPFQGAVKLALRLRADRAVWRDLDGSLPLTMARSDLAAAEMAVALMAVRGSWIGAAAPVPFAEAVDRVRKAMRQTRPEVPAGDTGRTIVVKPAPGRLVPLPDRPGEYLLPEATAVPDTVYWRRRVADGDAIHAE